MPFPPFDPIIALCTFTLETGEVLSLGVDDCYVEIIPESNERTRYVVHAQFVSREGTPFFIEGIARGESEVYLHTLVNALGGYVTFETISIGGKPIAIPKPGAKSGTLDNPFTGLSVSGLYFESASHQDSGGRAYGIEFSFVQPAGGAADETGGVGADLIFKGVDIGNYPASVSAAVSTSFIEYTAKTVFRPPPSEVAEEEENAALTYDTAKYLTDLAEALEFSSIVEIPLPRGEEGSRAVIKSYFANPDTLEWVSRSGAYPDVWLKSLAGTESSSGLLEITAVFVKVR